jgi:hypothetical protein
MNGHILVVSRLQADTSRLIINSTAPMIKINLEQMYDYLHNQSIYGKTGCFQKNDYFHLTLLVLIEDAGEKNEYELVELSANAKEASSGL